MSDGVLLADESAQSVLSVLKRNLNSQLYDTWFSKVQMKADAAGKTLEVQVPNSFYRDWIKDHYSDELRRSAFTAMGIKPALIFSVRSELSPAQQSPGVKAPNLKPPRRQKNLNFFAAHSDIQLNRNYTFANFVTGPNNQLSYSAAQAVVASPGRSYNPLFVHGSVGLGKTHLLQAVCHELLGQENQINILYLSCETFVNHFISSIEKGNLENFRYRYRHVDVLLIDDIQFLASKDRTQEEFFHTFNTLHNANKQIVLSSDSPPDEIPTLKDRLVSRFSSGLVLQIEPPAFETRVAIVQKKGRLSGREIPPDVAQYLAGLVSTNIRELEGAVVKVIGFANLMNRPLDINLAHEAFRDRVRDTLNVVNIDDITAMVTELYSVKKADLQSKRRLKSFSLPRQICMYLARRLTRLSLDEIGGYFGGRDHTTVLYATERIENLRTADDRLAATLESLQARLVRQR